MNRPQGATVGGDVKRLSPLRDFLHTESAGAILLAASALAALVWANSPWSDSYDSLWENRLVLSFAGHSLDLDLRHWVNDGLMAIFFFVVGLEIKRELVAGELRDPRQAALPVMAALGGMLAPAGTPPEIVARMNAEMVKVLKLPPVQERLKEMGVQVSASSPDEFGKFVRSEVERWGKVVRENNIKAGQ